MSRLSHFFLSYLLYFLSNTGITQSIRSANNSSTFSETQRPDGKNIIVTAVNNFILLHDSVRTLPFPYNFRKHQGVISVSTKHLKLSESNFRVRHNCETVADLVIRDKKYSFNHGLPG